MNPWVEAKLQAGCRCPVSDAWRCARWLRQVHCISCWCPCHNYLRVPLAAPSPNSVRNDESPGKKKNG